MVMFYELFHPALLRRGGLLAIQVFRSLSRMAAAEVEMMAAKSQRGRAIICSGFDDPNTANSVTAAMA